MLTDALTAHTAISRVAEEAQREYLSEKARREAIEELIERWYLAFEADVDSDPFEVATRVRRDDAAWQKATGCDRPQDAKLQSVLELSASASSRYTEKDALRIKELEAECAALRERLARHEAGAKFVPVTANMLASAGAHAACKGLNSSSPAQQWGKTMMEWLSSTIGGIVALNLNGPTDDELRAAFNGKKHLEGLRAVAALSAAREASQHRWPCLTVGAAYAMPFEVIEYDATPWKVQWWQINRSYSTRMWKDGAWTAWSPPEAAMIPHAIAHLPARLVKLADADADPVSRWGKDEVCCGCGRSYPHAHGKTGDVVIAS